MGQRDYRDYPDGFGHLGEDVEVTVHTTAAADDPLPDEAEYTGSLFAYLADADSNPGFREAFGDGVTPKDVYDAVAGGGRFVFGGGACPVFVVQDAALPRARAPGM